MRILVTEDEKDLADALAKGLERQGYAVDVAYDGEESLRLAEVNDYDLLILDLNLPKVDGMEVCKRLRDSGSSIGILMLTARAGLGRVASTAWTRALTTTWSNPSTSPSCWQGFALSCAERASTGNPF